MFNKTVREAYRRVVLTYDFSILKIYIVVKAYTLLNLQTLLV